MSSKLLLLRPSFNPGSLGSKLATWHNVKNTSSISLSGSDVTGWADLWTNGKNYAQATAAARPDYTASDANGRPAVRFAGDGASHFENMSLADSAAVRGTQGSFYAVVSFYSDTGAQGRVWWKWIGTTEWLMNARLDQPTDDLSVGVGNGVTTAFSGLSPIGAPYTAKARLLEFHHNGTDFTSYVNGVAGETKTLAMQSGTSDIYIGSTFSTFDYGIHELVHCTTVNNADEIYKMRQYFNRNWAIGL